MASKRGRRGKASKGLTKKEQAFVAAYMLNHNGAEAYGIAYPASRKHKPAYRAEKACKLLKKAHIAQMVAVRAEKLAAVAEQKFEITAERVLQELAAIAYANSDDYYRWGFREVPKLSRNGKPILDENGDPVLVPVPFAYVKNSDGLTRVQKAAIVGAEMSFARDGTPVVAVRMADKRGALKDLGQFLKLFSERVEHTGRDGGPIELKAPDLAGITDAREALKEFESFRARLITNGRANGHA